MTGSEQKQIKAQKQAQKLAAKLEAKEIKAELRGWNKALERWKKKGALLPLLFVFFSCSKQEMKPLAHNCEKVTILSYKYTLPDTSFFRLDTLQWYPGEPSRVLCDSTLNAFKKSVDSSVKKWRLCSLNLIEKIVYVFEKK